MYVQNTDTSQRVLSFLTRRYHRSKINCLVSPRCLTLPQVTLTTKITVTKQKVINKVRPEFKNNTVLDLKKAEKFNYCKKLTKQLYKYDLVFIEKWAAKT